MGIELPDLGLGGAEGVVGGNVGTIILFSLVILLIAVGGGVAIYFMRKLKIYNKKIQVFENISGKGYQPVYKDRARLVKLGDGGEELLYLRKKKLYRAAYGKKMGINTYWFAIGQDGYWYNIVLGDVDAKMGMLDIEPIDRDMRYMHVAIRKNIQNRYNKPNAFEKYGTYIMSGIFLVVMLVGIWMLLDKIGGISSGAVASVKASKEVVIATERIIASLDNICRGATSPTIVPVT